MPGAARRQRYLVTGGAGFIGSALVRHLIGATPHDVVVLDKLTYAGNLDSLEPVARDPRFRFVHGDIANRALFGRLIRELRPDAIIHLAAESHVDPSIDAASDFIHTNVVGTFTLLEEALGYWRELAPPSGCAFAFTMYRTTRFLAPWPPTAPSPSIRLTGRRRPMPPPRPPPTIWCGRGTIPTVCRSS